MTIPNRPDFCEPGRVKLLAFPALANKPHDPRANPFIILFRIFLLEEERL